MAESTNTLYLKFDGNTIEVDAMNANISQFIKEIRKYEISN